MLDQDKSIHEVLIAGRRLSIQELRHTRFYLQPKADSTAPVHVFLSGLPGDMGEGEYAGLLEGAFGGWDEGVIRVPDVFPGLGSVVVEFRDLRVYESYSEILLNLEVEGKAVKSLLLDQIKVDLMPWSSSPLIVFVNTKSGGQYIFILILF